MARWSPRWSALQPGDVIRLPRGRRAGLGGDSRSRRTHPRDPRPLVLTQGRWAGRLSPADFALPIDVLGRVRVPRNFNHRSAPERRDLAAELERFDAAGYAATAAPGDAPPMMRISLGSARHCGPTRATVPRPRGARSLGRTTRPRLLRERDAVQSRIDGRTDSLGRAFDRICALLDERGYLNGDDITPAGRSLARIWCDADLVVARMPARRCLGGPRRRPN